MGTNELADRILSFIERHAGVRPDYDPRWDKPDERFTGPDSVLLWQAAERLKTGQQLEQVHSDYGSGTYRPWNDTAARAEHDALVVEVNSIAKTY